MPLGSSGSDLLLTRLLMTCEWRRGGRSQGEEEKGQQEKALGLLT